jgi:hypothetical protein
MSRALESRIERLERNNGTNDPDQFFVIWCRPEEDEEEKFLAAAKQGLFILGEKGMWPDGKAVCCHWTSDDPMPEPRWTTLRTITEEELIYMLVSVKARLLRNGQITQEDWDGIDQGVQSLKDPHYLEKQRNERLGRFGRPRSLQ